MTNRRFDCRLLAGHVVHLSPILSIYRRLTGAGGIGAPSRPPFGVRRVLLARKSMVGFSFASFFASTRFLPSSLAGMPFFVCASDVSANGWGETSLVALASLPDRGHEKLSARPAGAAKAAPRLKTFAAIGPGVACAGWLSAPRRSPRSPPPMESGSTGPTSGLAPAVGTVSALGSPTGTTTWLDITRRRSRSTYLRVSLRRL